MLRQKCSRLVWGWPASTAIHRERGLRAVSRDRAVFSRERGTGFARPMANKAGVEHSRHLSEVEDVGTGREEDPAPCGVDEQPGGGPRGAKDRAGEVQNRKRVGSIRAESMSGRRVVDRVTTGSGHGHEVRSGRCRPCRMRGRPRKRNGMAKFGRRTDADKPFGNTVPP